MKLRTAPRLRAALLWPLVAAVGIVAPLTWFVANAPLETGIATLLLDTVKLLLPLAARATELEPRETHQVLRELGSAHAIRITLIADDGKVLAESSLPWEQMLAMDDHGTRPEVLAALSAGSGTSVRRSDTLERYFAYAAQTFRGADDRLYILRLARPLEQAHLLRRNLAAVLLLAVASGLAILAPIFWWLHRGFFQPLREILQGAGRLAGGDFSVRVESPPSGELEPLAASLNHLAEEVEARIEMLASERNELREILGNMSEPVMVTDPSGRVRRANAAAEKLFEDAGHVFGRQASELDPALGTLVARAFDSGRAESAELQLGCPEPRAHAVLASPLPDGHGAVVAARDLTDTLRLAEIHRDLVANVSHELKTPLTAIRGYAETLEDGALAKPRVAAKFVTRILEQCVRLESLLGDLLILARLESHGMTEQPVPVDLSHAAQQAVDALAESARQRGVALELDMAEGLPRLSGYPEELRTLLLNLIENGIKYNREGGSVTVELTNHEGRVELVVQDNGIGIPQDALDRIFERFYRVDKGRSREQGGTGLGLALVKHAVRIHGGSIAVESTLGAGTTFRIRLPVPPP